MSLLTGVTLLAVDTETTGFDVGKGERVVEVAYVRIADGRIAGEWSSFVHPGKPIPPEVTRIHGITDAMVAGAPPLAEVGRALREACADLPLVFHNAPFDLPFLRVLFEEAGVPPLRNPIVDTLGLARELNGSSGNRLEELSRKLALPKRQSPVERPGASAVTDHGAIWDAYLTAQLLLRFAERWEAGRGPCSLAELAAASMDKMRLTARR